MKKLITICFLMVISVGYSQSHQSGGKWCCKLISKGCDGVGQYPCPACVAKEKKEQEAKKKEDKRRADAVYAASKAKQKARELEIIKEKELAEKNKPKEVFVTMPSTNSSKIKNAPIKKSADSNDGEELIPVINWEHDGRLFSNGGYFNYARGETILSNKYWREAYSVTERSPVYDCKLNTGIVHVQKLEKFDYYNSMFSSKYSSYNIVNYKGEYLLPENEVRKILHIKDNWFFITNKNETNYLINLTTKEKIEIPYFANRNDFTPIYSENVKMNNRHHNDVYPYFSIKVKSDLMKLKPNIINENFLKQYNFVIVHANCNYEIQFVFETGDKLNTGTCPTTLYCFSKDGKMTKMTL